MQMNNTSLKQIDHFLIVEWNFFFEEKVSSEYKTEYVDDFSHKVFYKTREEGVWLKGAFRDEHAWYTVAVDISFKSFGDD